MTQFTFAQLEGLWIQAGGDPRYASIAAAVAMAESDGKSDSLGHNPGSTDVGLWQINGPGGGDLRYLDPITNVKEAIRQSHNGVDWHPWCTAYSDGACGTKGGHYSLSNSPAGTRLRQNGGNIPPNFTSPGSSGGVIPAGNTAKLNMSYNSQTCAWGIDLGSFSTPQSFFGFPLPSLTAKAGFCVISKTQARAILGGLLVGAGSLVLMWGVGVLVAYTMKRTVGIDSLAKATEAIPGVGKASGKIASKTSSSVAKTLKSPPVADKATIKARQRFEKGTDGVR
jgi:hypothetical protein